MQTEGIDNPQADRSMQPEGIEAFIAKAEALQYWYPWGTEAVQLQAFRRHGARIAQLAREVTPIIHASIPRLLQEFISAKATLGTPQERQVYASLDPQALLARLLRNRPVSFWGTGDRHCLKTELQPDGTFDSQRWGGFETIGTTEQSAPLLLRDYMSYDEMCLSALVSVWVPTLFINRGDRRSWCVPGELGTFEQEGVMVGCVGARLVKEGAMEARFMLVTPDQNTLHRGYGRECRDPMLRLWAKFYGVDYFPTYDEVRAAPGTRFHKVEPWEQQGQPDNAAPQFLDALVYSRRIRRVVLPFLVKAAQARGVAGSHVRVKGLGLGVWQVDSVQEALMLDVYAEVLCSVPLPGLEVLEFAWFPTAKSLAGVPHGGRFRAHGGRDIEIRFTSSGFAAPVEEGRRLVAMYAWDGNAYPGNEWWAGLLGSTDDSAAASCSLISSLQNPDVNSARLKGEVAQVIADDGNLYSFAEAIARADP